MLESTESYTDELASEVLNVLEVSEPLRDPVCAIRVVKPVHVMFREV